MNDDGLSMIFSCFGVEGRGRGFTINDLYSFYKYQATSDKQELIRALSHVYGKAGLIERLNGKKDEGNNSRRAAMTINEVQFLNSNNEITDNLKQLANEIFYRCDKDRDGLLNSEEYNNYFRLIGMDT
eukprot:jgi/Orpsp1_1/1184845/evm.model.c7180000091229.1